MIDPFEAPRIKIERAKWHLEELEAEMRAYFQRGAAFVAFEMADDCSKDVGWPMGAFVYREREPVPLAWAAIIGDVIHNFRASLDLMVSDIHRTSGGNPQDIKHVHYSFCKEKSEMSTTIKARRLSRVGRDYLDVIEYTAPYMGGNEGLRAVHDLDRIDKHQALVPTISIVSIDWPVPIKKGSQQLITGVTKDGQHIMLFPPSFCKLPLGSRIKADFSVIFGDVPIFRGTFVDKQLSACIASVEVILNSFKAVAAQRASNASLGSP